MKYTLLPYSLLLFSFLFMSSFHKGGTSSLSKYKTGDIVKCCQWDDDSYWRGKVVKVVKGVIYQVELEKIRVNHSTKIYLNPSECTGKKRLSYEDGADYKQTKIWVHERCLEQ